MKKAWELLALLVIGALLLKAALEFVEPLIPYIVVVALLMLGGGIFYSRKRMW
jgi:hypothetical protein